METGPNCWQNFYAPVQRDSIAIAARYTVRDRVFSASFRSF